MNVEMIILNKMRYSKDGKEKSRLGYFLTSTESFSNRENFIGYSDLSVYSDDTRFFDKIPTDFIGQKCTAEVQEVPNALNPMKSRKEFVSITCNGKTVRLV